MILVMLLRMIGLFLALSAQEPKAEPSLLAAHTILAVRYETTELPAELLLGIAKVESNFLPGVISRPPHARAWGFCGALQTMAWTEAACRQQLGLSTAYPLAVTELSRWHRDRNVRGDLPRMLRGYGCGYHGVLTGRCNGYDKRVLRYAQQLRRKWQPNKRAI